jgi:hypothetical protein
MKGEIKLGGWLPFEAEQVVVWDRGYVWRAKVHKGIMSIKGFDRIVDGVGEMRWRVFGLVPVLNADGPDISRSAHGRHEIESTLMPSIFLDVETTWSTVDHDHANATLHHGDQDGELHLDVAEDGRLRSAWLMRWGNPDGGEHHEVPFGALMSEEQVSFAGHTIAKRLRAGWHFQGGEFEGDGEFFRAEILEAEYR